MSRGCYQGKNLKLKNRPKYNALIWMQQKAIPDSCPVFEYGGSIEVRCHNEHGQTIFRYYETRRLST
jgi:hypothetical protein